MGPTWLDELKARTVSEVLTAAGLEVAPRGGFSCPTCGADRRGSSDARAPVGVRRDDHGWHCHRCGGSGDAVTLAAILATGQAKPNDWIQVGSWASSRGLCSAPPGTTLSRVPAPLAPQPRPPAPAPVERVRPPAAEVAALWSACVPVTSDGEVSAWLQNVRGLDPAIVEDLGLARALPDAAALPRWARVGSDSWIDSGHRLLMPAFDEHGRMVSVRARRVVDRADKKPKALPPAGYEIGGCVLACGLARLMLSGEALGDGRPAAELVREVGLVVVEGEPDFLVWATRWSDGAALERAPAVLGLFAGSWTPELATRVPEGVRVAVKTHADPAGDKYASTVAATLGGRCPILRAKVEA